MTSPDCPLVYYSMKWLAALSVCCVDLFALVSGYVGVATSPRWKRFGELWLQVAVTALIVTAAVKLHGRAEVGFKDWLGCAMPVSRCTYWYFTAYAGVFLLMPILNVGIRSLSRVQALTICGSGMFLFSFLTIPARAEFWCLHHGYSMLWLVLLYVFGGCLRLHVNLRGKAWVWMCLGIVCSFVTFFCDCWSPIPNRGQFLCYLNPSVVGSAVCFLIGFSKLAISGGGGEVCCSYRAGILWRLSLACSSTRLETLLVWCIQGGGELSGLDCGYVLRRSPSNCFRILVGA